MLVCRCMLDWCAMGGAGSQPSAAHESLASSELPSSSPAARARGIAEWLMAAFVTGAALFSIWQAVQQAQLPFQLDYEEGNILNAGVRIVQGLSPYPRPEAFPSVFNPYGPVGYWVTALCVRLGGVWFTLPRLVMLACAALIALMLFLLIQEWTGSVPVALAFGLYFLITDPARLWMPLLRVDLLAIALTLTGLWVCLPVLAGRDGATWRCPAAALFFTLAVFTKYTALAAPAACLLTLAARRDWRRTLLLAGSTGALCLAGFLAMQAATDGQFSFHMFRTHTDPYMFELLVDFLQVLLPSLAALIPLVLVFILIRPRAYLAAGFYLICAWVVPLVTGGKLGSSVNHFLEALAACCIAAALGYQKLTAYAGTRWLPPITSLVMCAAALYLPGALLLHSRISPEGFSGCRALYRRVQESPGKEVLSDNIGAVVLAGKVPAVSNPFVHAQLERARVISPKPLESAVAAGRFDLIVLDVDPANMKGYGTLGWRGPVLALIAKKYQVTRTYDCMNGKFLLEPKLAEKEAQPGERPPAAHPEQP